jgi:5-oxoprolinase (ATP-hydrolysing)
MNNGGWEFWIDVGGTFTDVVARRPAGTLVRHKLLSSGIVKGRVETGSNADSIVDSARSRDPAGFWAGATLRLLDERGGPVASAAVSNEEPGTGTLRLREKLSVEPHSGQAYELLVGLPAPVLAIRYLLGLARTEAVPQVVVRLGTTRGTNALITRRGARTALVTTRGFADVLRIGYQNRPRLFELAIRKHEPLFETAVEVEERVAADGTVLVPVDRAQVRQVLAPLREAGIESLAICLLHAYAFGSHEETVADIARELGFAEVSISSRVAPLVKIVSRGDTTVVDGYLNPVLRSYVQELRKELPAVDLRLMTSAGGLVTADKFIGKDSVLSGPAGGVVGCARVGEALGVGRLIGFDMGGTSTDVSRYDGRFELEYETEKGGVRIVAPMMAIETVAAGGGSICRFDGVKLVVGPESAGADPGPACYGRGGPITVTDLNLWLGKIPASRFPFPLDRSAVEMGLGQLVAEIERDTGRHYELMELCEGFLQIANANMVQAIRSISIAKGVDPADYALVSFGGAAPQHACAVARELGIQRVIDHPDAGVLSAYGIGLADVTRHAVRGIYQPLDAMDEEALEQHFAPLVQQAQDEVAAEGFAGEQIDVLRSFDLRYRGVDAFLTIPEPAAKPGRWRVALITAYEAAHRQLYGYVHADRPLELVSVRVEAIGKSRPSPQEEREAIPHQPEAAAQGKAWFAGQCCATPMFDRDALQAGARLMGPAIVSGAVATTVIDPGWAAEVLSGGELLLTDQGMAPRSPLATEVDPVQLEIFNNLFAAIAEQMGITLRQTSASVNVKERLDFSCALFTPTGDLVVNAPHIPVHLGAMGETVRRVLLDNPELQPGDVFVTNDPYRGGSHLPDITVVTPVHDARGKLMFLTASRAHHAEIGGIRPGSMPPFSRNLAEEGVLIRNFKLVAAGEPRWEALRELLCAGPYPTRNVQDNLADLAAQVAANQQGARDLLQLVERYSLPVVAAYMQHIQWAAEQKVRRALGRLEAGTRRFVDYLDDGTPIALTLTLDQERARFDFMGTGPVSNGNLNANRAIVTAAILYCLRLLIDEEIPLNQGVLAPVELVLPEGILNPPERATAEECAAVVGGNVETSQRVVDVILGALGLAAASQGTMNNLLFGDRTFGYYETICGGSGATVQRAGADAVHTHMTNTRLTDPEVLEQRYPVRLHEFSIRRGSGGEGLNRGGDGVVRRLEFLRPVDVSILSQRRGRYAPYGLAGGGAGTIGRNMLVRGAGATETLTGCVEFTAAAGDVLTIETPGGGGFGAAGAAQSTGTKSPP